jgi:hypothetical protein
MKRKPLRDTPLLATSTGSTTTKLLGLRSPRVRNQECPVVGDELLLELQRVVRVEVLGVVGNDRFGNGLTDSVDLGSMSTTLDTNTDIYSAKGILASNQDGLVNLETENLRLEEVDGGAVDVNKTTALLGVGDRSGGLASADVSERA